VHERNQVKNNQKRQFRIPLHAPGTLSAMDEEMTVIQINLGFALHWSLAKTPKPQSTKRPNRID
jgi:hypothetical protein